MSSTQRNFPLLLIPFWKYKAKEIWKNKQTNAISQLDSLFSIFCLIFFPFSVLVPTYPTTTQKEVYECEYYFICVCTPMCVQIYECMYLCMSVYMCMSTYICV